MKIKIVPSEHGCNVWSLKWSILSSKYFKPVHFFLHRSIRKLNQKLFDEDIPVKTQRKNLRLRGYEFINDAVDFLTGTTLYPNNIRRPNAPEVSIDIGTLSIGKKAVFKSQEREFIVLRTDQNAVMVWDGICSHQGASLSEVEPCDHALQCPWHGLKFLGTKLDNKTPTKEVSAFFAELQNQKLRIIPRVHE